MRMALCRDRVVIDRVGIFVVQVNVIIARRNGQP
jgi:hypothetical protein